ncbi:branched-chain amino acid ABC transporter substrate-binding protein [Oleidesulfovibrio sp.]|uniref:branched-chain amino acid ABC transporter substrate-binding protein n=1 Tax=Oleidesulfovibrio sp. TaxID=2909707 RepID=UPI003A83E4AE
MSRKLTAFVLSVLATVLMTVPAMAGTVKIGLMCPLTGSWASEGQDMRNIVMMLAEQVNKNGGINGDMVEIVVEDDAGDPKTAALAAQRLSTMGVAAVIGTYGSAITEASQAIYDEMEIVQVATGSTAIRLTEKGLPLFFRTCPRDDEQGRVAAAVLKEKGFKKLAILHDNTSYAKGLAEETLALVKKDGTEVVFYDALTPNERDYSAILTKLKAAGPDAIFFTGYYPEAGMLLRQKQEMKWDVPMMGGDATNNLDLVKIAGKSAAGYLFISPPTLQDLPNKEAKDFASSYEAKYGSMPASVWSVLAGDAFTVLAKAVEGTKSTDPEKIAEYLKTQLKDYPGLTGTLSFNEKGDRVGDLYRLYRVDEDGKFVLQP